MAVCSIGVSDTNSIPENVFSSAFKIFDQVKLTLFDEMKTVATRTRTIGFPFLKPGLYSASFFQFAFNRSRCGPTNQIFDF